MKSSTFVHRGHTLYYESYGNGDRPLVYMHGLLLDSGMNEGIARALAERGNRVVLLDLLGHGRSDKPTHASEYRIDMYADQVFALLDELEVREAVLGGMSLGANVSLFAAARRPERVRGLVIEMPVLENAVPTAALLFAPMVILAHYGRPLLRVTSSFFARFPRTRFGSLNSALAALSLPPESLPALLHGVLVGPTAPTQEERAAIATPAVVLGHVYDLIHPFADAANLARQLPNAELLHARSPVELRLMPDRLTGAVADFLDDVWAIEERGRSSA
ncbi:MAG: alpha/beta hydrolase [Actinobacteria bacterium ATB1]|nr:alpha/beta hydrolase [Actinobacteria bacterium ATB1]